MAMRRLSSYRVFLTRNTEYHVRGHVCFGIRDRRSGCWAPQHWALGKPLASAFPDAQGRMCSISSPQLGEPLWLLTESGPHRTSPLLAIEERAHLESDVLDPRLRAAAQQRPADSIRDTW